MPLFTVDPGWHPGPVTISGLPVDPDLARLLQAVRPGPRAVHALLAPRIDPATVDRIAESDYGQDYREHRAAITALLHSPDPPARLEWVPHEVLVLSQGLSAVTDLWIGSLLLGAATPHEEPLLRLAPFLRAALDLGGPERSAALSLLAWCRLTAPGDWPVCAGDQPFLTFGALLLSVVAEPTPPDEVLRGLAGGLIEELDRSVFDGEWIGRLEPPLIGRGPKKPGRAWRDLAGRVLVDGPLGDTEIDGRLAILGGVIRRDRVLPVEDLYALFA